MSAFADLLPAAMIGTDKHATAVPVMPGEIGQVLVSATEGRQDPADRMMCALGILAGRAQAAGRGRRAGSEPAPAASPDAVAETDALGLLQAVFGDGTVRLQYRACSAIAASGRRLPAAVLPAALDAAQRSRDLRVAVLAVIGQRGRWLAQFNDGWKFAAGATDEGDCRWTEGSLDERRLFLRAERARDAGAARDRLASSLDELPARERAELLGCLAVNLGGDDEPFLEDRLADRSREVRQLAASLLAALPRSAFAQRAAARIEELLKQDRSIVRKAWTIEAPQAFDDAWKADGVERDRPAGESLGERAWWLLQLVRGVPLSWWQERLQLQPANLLRWPRDTSWAEAIVRAWRQALAVDPQPEWCDALLDDWPDKQLREDPSGVLALLTPVRREKYWVRQLQGDWLGRSEPLGDVVARVLAGTPLADGLSPALSSQLVQAVAATLQTEPGVRDWSLRERLPELAAALDAASAAALAETRLHEQAPPSLREIHGKLLRVVDVRRALRF